MAAKTTKKSKFLPPCLCGIDVPHENEEVQKVQKTVMPTLMFPKLADCETSWTVEMGKTMKKLEAAVDETKQRTRSAQRQIDSIIQKKDLDDRGEPDFKDLAPQPINYEKKIDEIQYLKRQLSISLTQQAAARNAMHSLKQEIVNYKRILTQEIGEKKMFSIFSPGWKGRSQQILALKLRIVSLEQELQEHRHRSRVNPQYSGPYDPRPVSATEKLVPRRQREVLRDIYRERKQEAEKGGKQLDELVKDYEHISLMYKSCTTRNKMLDEEIRSLKEQVCVYEKRTQSDKELIECLMAHQAQMRDKLEDKNILDLDPETFSKNLNEVILIDESDDIEEADAHVYKTLWKTSECEKKDLQDIVSKLGKRLDDISRQVVEAEKHCIDNLQHSHYLDKEVEIMRNKTTMNKEAVPVKGQKKTLPPVKNKLKVLQEENEFLRSFLQKLMLTKEDDYKLYQFSLHCVRQQYLRSLAEFKQKCDDGSSTNVISTISSAVPP